MAGKKKIKPPRTEDVRELKRWYLKLCEEINKTHKGNCTLTANAATTTITDTNVLAASRIILFPTSANAAADVGSATGVYVSTKTTETSFVITHPNNANADKTFDYIIQN